MEIMKFRELLMCVGVGQEEEVRCVATSRVTLFSKSGKCKGV